ncbi:FACT complex subunit SSRP1 [Tanacetum coccineum]
MQNVGQLKVHSRGLAWKKQGGGKAVKVDVSKISRITWMKVSRSNQLGVQIKDGLKYKFIGFRDQVNVHAWNVKTDSLPTRFNVSRRCIDIDFIMCAICDNGVETFRHLFFYCCMVRQIVRKITRIDVMRRLVVVIVEKLVVVVQDFGMTRFIDVGDFRIGC